VLIIVTLALSIRGTISYKQALKQGRNSRPQLITTFSESQFRTVKWIREDVRQGKSKEWYKQFMRLRTKSVTRTTIPSLMKYLLLALLLGGILYKKVKFRYTFLTILLIGVYSNTIERSHASGWSRGYNSMLNKDPVSQAHKLKICNWYLSTWNDIQYAKLTPQSNSLTKLYRQWESDKSLPTPWRVFEVTTVALLMLLTLAWLWKKTHGH